MGTWSTCYAVPWRPGEARPGQGDKEACSGCGVGGLRPSAWFLSALARWGWPRLVCPGLLVWSLTSLPWYRYVVESPRMPLSVSLKPPFLRPELLDRAVPLKVKLSDNGLKSGRSKVGVWTGTVRRLSVGCVGGDRKKR